MEKIFTPALGAILICLFASTAALAAEPTFCDPAAFAKLEQPVHANGVLNLHMYKLGKVLFAGMAVGTSITSAVEKLAADSGKNLSAREKSCTWYHNDGNPDAARAFVHRYVDKPNNDVAASVAQYMQAMTSSFDQDAISLISCAEDHGYLAVGCDGMKHRGPTVFAMVLSFAGCTAEHSVAIVNKTWGTNGIPTPTRIAIAQAAYDLGTAHSDTRARFQAIFHD
jgi:hypothetical protein